MAIHSCFAIGITVHPCALSMRRMAKVSPRGLHAQMHMWSLPQWCGSVRKAIELILPGIKHNAHCAQACHNTLEWEALHPEPNAYQGLKRRDEENTPLWPAAGVVVGAFWVQGNLRASHHHSKGHVVQLLLLERDALVRQRSTYALHMDRNCELGP